MQASNTSVIRLVGGQQLFQEFTRRTAFVERTSGRAANSGYLDRRRVKRYEPQAASVQISVSYPDGIEAPALLADLSTHGAELVADRLPSRDEIVRLTFDLTDCRLAIDGLVRYSGSDDTFRYFGVQFLDPAGSGGTNAGDAAAHG